MRLTVEEENLLDIFHEDGMSRKGMISKLRASMPDLDGQEMCDIAENLILFLRAITDEQYENLDISPVYDTDGEDENDNEDTEV
jgi:hypothetical protein